MKTLLMSLGVLLTAYSANATIVFHEVDTQLTFWEGSKGVAPGPLAVTGSNGLEATISEIKKMSLIDKRIKAVASVDYHFDYEIINKDVFPEFQQFPAHGMALEDGPLGAARIPEVLIYPEDKIYNVEHHRVINGQWVLVPQELDENKILDESVEVVIRKNGLGSYSVFANPKTQQIYSMLAPKAVFVYGVATDFCVHAAVMGLRERGYTTYVIEDAISGIFPDLMAVKTKEMKDAGAIFIKFSEVSALVESIEK